MKEFTKIERRQLKDIIKVGILRCHARWLEKMKALIMSPYADGENEFDRSMKITSMSHKFYKEAMIMEQYYQNTWLEIGVLNLLHDGYISLEELSALPKDLEEYFRKKYLR